MAFKKKDDQARSAVLDQFAQEAQELGLGYRWITRSLRFTTRMSFTQHLFETSFFALYSLA
ncbi:MAG: hypothetical protein ACK5E3_12655 [Planctomycetota bacterium]|jgi:hypothetical protein